LPWQLSLPSLVNPPSPPRRLSDAWIVLGLVTTHGFGDALEDGLEKRQVEDSYKILVRIRNGHACIMSIVFIILFPLGAISVHLPIDRVPFLRNTYLKQKILAIHAPIQILGLFMMLAGMSLGVRLALDLDYLTLPIEPRYAHPVIGLVVVCTIAVFQPLLGSLQHMYFRRTGRKSVYAYLHRWIGRSAIILGIINNGLGFQLASYDINIPKTSYIRNFVLAGALALIWFALVIYDWVSPQTATKDTRNVSNELSEAKVDA
jgi:hypothetical protein